MDYKDAKSAKELYNTIYKEIEEATYKIPRSDSKKKLYYISAEFLTGKMLVNTLINAGLYDKAEKSLEKLNISLSEIEKEEDEPSLGNGGLGRLAACFMDSAANLSLNAEGMGINYHFGLFRQEFVDNKQLEKPNPWMHKNVFLKKTPLTYNVEFGNLTLKARAWQMDIVGRGGRVNKLTLFDTDSVDESIVKNGIEFDKSDYAKNLTLFLYPDDSDESGRLLRVYQEYFMASCSAQKIIDECMQKGSTLYDLHRYAAVQINDTHPSFIIPELIRLLIKRGLTLDEAIDTISKTVAYTNHTILSEALEKWPMHYLKKAVPNIVPIIEILDDRIRRKYQDSSVYIIDSYDTVHMAHMDIHYSFSINGVAKLHTEILKNTELNNFYRIYPEKFNNKTNGISFSRWLFKSNPALTKYITELIGDGFYEDSSHLKKLAGFENDKKVLKKLIEIKKENKINLKKFIKDTQGISINENAIFDMQIKRLHEYKRQQMNVLGLINMYLEIKKGNTPKTPVCAIFAAKASPAYTIAKDIIHLILCLGKVIQNDEKAREHLQVVMIENYNVTSAEVLIPACDISEQISLASKEASGTGNMKFMLNGGVILGTEDGANVEIHSLVGDDNIYIFGERADTVIERYKRGDYVSRTYYENNEKLKEAVDFITSEAMLSHGDRVCLTRIKDELINKDWFMTFPDFDDYTDTRKKAYLDYEDKELWAKKMLANIGNAGYFSSDRTIAQYNSDIWQI